MEDRCICCGAAVPEGRQICWNCEHKQSLKNSKERQDTRRNIKHYSSPFEFVRERR